MCVSRNWSGYYLSSWFRLLSTLSEKITMTHKRLQQNTLQTRRNKEFWGILSVKTLPCFCEHNLEWLFIFKCLVLKLKRNPTVLGLYWGVMKYYFIPLIPIKIFYSESLKKKRKVNELKRWKKRELLKNKRKNTFRSWLRIFV